MLHDGRVTSSTRLLVLEDDEGLRTSLRLVMEDQGYDVYEASDAERALQIVEEPGVDLMLVDLMLGGMDGFSFIQRARPRTEAPIVVVSARDRSEDIVTALEAGADDYMTKPFSVEELQARVRALLRRPSIAGASDRERTEDVVVLDPDAGPLLFDIGAAVLRSGDTELHLTQTEFRLLSVLAQNAGRVLSRSTLLQHVWDQGFFGDERIVDVHVRRLRKKVEQEPGTPRILVTVRGLGYRLDLR
jgi:DNA-binding response OmpR family regulator